MLLIIIRRLVGGLFLAAGIFVLGDEIGLRGTIGVMLIILGLMTVSGIKEFWWTLSQELKAKREKKTTAS
ncbi:hypothetical protein HQ587_06235 [bacterium]|nr:hypothetical protein [bacterium]